MSTISESLDAAEAVSASSAVEAVHTEQERPLEYASSCCIPTTWIDLPLLSITPYNHDTSIFSFGLPKGAINPGLPTCGCLLMMAPGADHDGSDAIRPYTPISPPNTLGRFDLLIKRYGQWGDKCVPGTIWSAFSYNITAHSYKPQGAMSNYIFSRKVGDTLKVSLSFFFISLIHS